MENGCIVSSVLKELRKFYIIYLCTNFLSLVLFDFLM
jgi:hypothetical protein